MLSQNLVLSNLFSMGRYDEVLGKFESFYPKNSYLCLLIQKVCKIGYRLLRDNYFMVEYKSHFVNGQKNYSKGLLGGFDFIDLPRIIIFHLKKLVDGIKLSGSRQSSLKSGRIDAASLNFF